MLVVFFLVISFCYYGNCYQIPVHHSSYNDKLLGCVTEIVREYFAERKFITYVGNKVEDEELLKAINTAGIIALISKQSSKKILVPHEGYLISAKNASLFAKRFPSVTKESTWNPRARFLIIVRALEESHLKILFDTFLRLHAINVVVVNATEDAHLYTFNPFDNYSCGKRYEKIISYGKCSHALSINLYPEKVISGLRNCTFNVLISQWPPYTAIYSNDTDSSSPLREGAEPYLFRLVGEMLGFEIETRHDFDGEEFPTVSNNMEAMGALKKLQDNEVDVVLGGMLLTPSRAVAFDYVYEQLAYTDEIRFVVKRASTVPPWKNIYLEFESTVWVLLILALIFFSMLIIILLRAEDKSHVVLRLLDSLVLHGHNIQCRMAVKCILIMWVWFAYLVNTFYQSSLVSLTTNPAQEYQISSEEDIAKYKLKPCFSSIMEKYYKESVQLDDTYQQLDGCYGLMESIETVMKSKDKYTILLYGQYLYNKHDFYDEYGKSRVMSVQKPYSKVIYSVYLYKGFPLIDKLHYHALQLKEMGLVDKSMQDMIFLKQLKNRFHVKKFRGSFAIPWRINIFGWVLSFITFVIEVLS